MPKILLLFLSTYCLLVGCNSSNTSHTTLPSKEEIQAIPTPEPSPKPIAKGTMTNQPTEEIPTVEVDESNMIPPKELLSYVQDAIIPLYKNWVLLKNGTYIIFDNMENIQDIKVAALQLLEKHRPKTPEENHWDFSITELDKVQGWSIYGNGYGIYTFVHSKELPTHPSPQTISSYAKAKRALDEKEPHIIFISSPQGVKAAQ